MVSYRKISETIVMASGVDWDGHDNQKELCIYGMEMLIATAVNILIVCAISIFLKLNLEVMVFLIFFFPGRLFAGGWHARSHIRCIISFCIFMFGIIMVSRYLEMILTDADYHWGLCILLAVITVFYLNYKYAARSKQKLIHESHRRYVSFICGINAFLISLLYINTFQHTDVRYYILIAIGAMLMQAITLLPGLNEAAMINLHKKGESIR